MPATHNQQCSLGRGGRDRLSFDQQSAWFAARAAGTPQQQLPGSSRLFLFNIYIISPVTRGSTAGYEHDKSLELFAGGRKGTCCAGKQWVSEPIPPSQLVKTHLEPTGEQMAAPHWGRVCCTACREQVLLELGGTCPMIVALWYDGDEQRYVYPRYPCVLKKCCLQSRHIVTERVSDFPKIPVFA